MSCRILWVVALVVAAILPLQIAPVAAGTPSVPTITAIAAGGAHTCALTSGGGVTCWGYTEQLISSDGTGNLLPVPVDLSGLASGVSAISAGGNHTCALTSGRRVMCWGSNDFGQLGNGTTTASSIAVDVQGFTSGISTIAAGWGHTCALTSRGRVKCWGYNGLGGLGNGTTTHSLVPVDVSGLPSGISAIAAGEGHTCALTRGGGIRCWGSNEFGQLGDGTTTDRLTAVDVSGLASGVSAIAVGGRHTCALTSGGGVKCWGWNDWGQVGDGTTTDSNTPVDVAGLASGVGAIAAGFVHNCALMNGGGVECWGLNVDGQLGNGLDSDISTTPVDVDFASQGSPPTDTADPGDNASPTDFPLFPLLAGLAAGIAMLVRRHGKGRGVAS